MLRCSSYPREWTPHSATEISTPNEPRCQPRLQAPRIPVRNGPGRDSLDLMTRDELLAQLAGLRQARVGQVRVPHKPLLLLWLSGQFAATGSSQASYQQAEAPVSQLINEFGPPVASAAAARQRAAMPFVHLERELWDLRDATGEEIAPDAPERRAWLLDRGAVGRLRPPVEQLLADPVTLAAALPMSRLEELTKGRSTTRCCPRQPLRFLLADDPGAGKTIMTGDVLQGADNPGRCRALPRHRPGEPGRAVAG